MQLSRFQNLDSYPQRKQERQHKAGKVYATNLSTTTVHHCVWLVFSVGGRSWTWRSFQLKRHLSTSSAPRGFWVAGWEGGTRLRQCGRGTHTHSHTHGHTDKQQQVLALKHPGSRKWWSLRRSAFVRGGRLHSCGGGGGGEQKETKIVKRCSELTGTDEEKTELLEWRAPGEERQVTGGGKKKEPKQKNRVALMGRLNVVLDEFLSAFKLPVKKAQTLDPQWFQKAARLMVQPTRERERVGAASTGYWRKKENNKHLSPSPRPPFFHHDGHEESPPVRGGGGGETRFNQCLRCE